MEGLGLLKRFTHSLTERNNMKKLIVVAAAFILFTQAAYACDKTWVKYRNTPVCLDQFQAGDTSGSSFVRGAWYDASKDYMVIDLNGTKYHYCRFPSGTWKGLLSSTSHDRYYKTMIKGRYDCRKGGVPKY